MKNILLAILIAIPSLSFAQQSASDMGTLDGAPLNLNPTGTYLLKSSRDLLIGTGLEIGGGAIAIIAGQSDTPEGVYLGGALALAGLIYQFVGYSNIGKAAKTLPAKWLSFSGAGISYSF